MLLLVTGVVDESSNRAEVKPVALDSPALRFACMQNSLLLQSVVWVASVGTATSLVRWSIRKSFDRICGERKWYKRLGEVKRRRLAGALTVAAHHLVVVSGMAYALKTRDQDIYRIFLQVEIGFDISDTYLAITSASMTGMSRLPVLMHHCVAILFSSFAMSHYIPMSWQTGANVAYNLLLAGAVDTIALRTLPFLPVYKNTAAMISMSLLHLAVFFKCRVSFFFQTAGKVLERLDTHRAWHKPILAGCTSLALYHLALGVTIIRTVLNKGRLPKPSAKFLEKQKLRQEWESLSQEERDQILNTKKKEIDSERKRAVYARLRRK